MPEETPTATTFRISSLIRLTLSSLYVALTVPLPFLSEASGAPVPPGLLWIGIALGFGVLSAALSDRVVLDAEGIRLTYPAWVPRLLRRGWSLSWSEIAALNARTTGQGGLVYYFVTPERDRAYLLPARVAGFARMLREIEARTDLDTRDVRPLAQPWMYGILLGFTLLLLLVDAWTIATALSVG